MIFKKILLFFTVLLTVTVAEGGTKWICNDTLYISNQSNLETGSSSFGETWLHTVNQANTPFDYRAIGTAYKREKDSYNAMAYNIKDNFIYAMYRDELLKIDSDGGVTNLGKVDGYARGQLYAGEFDRDGFYYITGTGGDSDIMYKIDVTAKKVINTIPLSSAVKFWDMAIDPSGDYFYVMLLKNGNGSFVNDHFAKIRISDGQITTIGEDKSSMSSYIGLIFSDKSGDVFIMSQENGFYKIDPTTGEYALISQTKDLTFFNDGTSCPDAELNILDYGDAPDKYTHVSHRISDNLYLGNSKPDAESDQQSSLHATDDGDDDRDGVISKSTLTIGDETYSVPVKVFNNTGEIAYITAWIDFNRNGTFEYKEALNTNNLQVSSSDSTQTINIEWSNDFENQLANLTAGKAIMRIRLSTSRVLRCDDAHYKDNDNSVQENYFISPDGEVEDYEITIQDNVGEPFTCNNEGIIFSGDTDATSSQLLTVDLDTKTQTVGSNFGTRHINASGYNVLDNYIYGVGFKNSSNSSLNIVKIDKNYNVQNLNISGVPYNDNDFYALGDVSFDNKYYISRIDSRYGYTYLQKLVVIDLNTSRVERITPLVFPEGMIDVKAADYAFNPKDHMLYTVDSRLNELIRINPITGDVEKLGDIGAIGNAYSVISFFDLNGNFLFTNKDNTTIYKIDISDPSNINTKATPYITGLDLPSSGDGAKCAYSKLPYESFLGTFNVERTNSGDFEIGTDARNAWYTQIAGRDFDYSVLFYEENGTSLKEVNNVTIKIELVNQDTNKTLYERYAYIPKDAPTSRVDVVSPTDDLSSLPATRKAIFRISYGVDENQSIIQEDCTTDFKSCYEETTKTHINYNYAKDNFAIRPESFYIELKDKTTTLKINRDPNNSIEKRVRLATGYDYNLTVIATQKGGDTPALEYNTTIERVLAFVKPSETSNCFDESNATSIETFKDGENSTKLFEHYNVGNYNLYLNDRDWTSVDWNKTIPDCNTNASNTSIDGNSLSGCNIESKPNLFVKFYPYQFNVNFAVNNLPNSNHPDFIYMTTSQDRSTALELNGVITAQSADDKDSTNFTKGCMAEDINLKINATTLTQDGINQLIQTSIDSNRNRTPVFFTRVIRYNSAVVEESANQLMQPSSLIDEEINRQVERITDPLMIDRDKFLNSNKGSTLINMRYNINKNLTEPINPVHIELHGLDVNSTDAFSSAEEQENFVPDGNQSLNNTMKNFYFTRVVPDEPIYKLDCTETLTLRTPLNIDVFCDANISLFRTTNIVGHVTVSSSPREQSGWFILRDHNSSTDGGILRLTPHDTNLDLSFTPAVDVNHTLELTNGRNGLLITAIGECIEGRAEIIIDVPEPLKYNPNRPDGLPTEIIETGLNLAPSQWSGIGKAGKVMGIEANTKNSNKIDW